MKRNDLEDITNRLERQLLVFHAHAKEEEKNHSPADSNPQEKSEVKEEAPLEPFCIVNSVAPESPAAESGMKQGDLIVSFSTITALTENALKSIPTVSRLFFLFFGLIFSGSGRKYANHSARNAR